MSDDPIRLSLGCGAYPIMGWRNYDICSFPGVIQRDLSRGLPESSESVQQIFSEHFFEHLQKDEAYRLLAECYRVLIPGGSIRVVMPDLRKIAQMYLNADPFELKNLGLYDSNGGSFCNFFNQAMRCWGHQYLWDEEEFRLALVSLHFREIRSVPRASTIFPGYRNVVTDFGMEAIK